MGSSQTVSKSSILQTCCAPAGPAWSQDSSHTMPTPFKAITVSQPAAGAPWLGRPLQRNMRVMAVQQQDLLSADEVAKAMEFQRRRSQVKAAGAPQAAAASLQVDRYTMHSGQPLPQI